jgi:Fe-S-cluster containining protein
MFQCLPNCGKCCTIVPIPADIFYAVSTHIQRNVTQVIAFEANNNTHVFPMTKDLICAFMDENKRCAIYNLRPTICRLCGVDKRVPCPYVDEAGILRPPEIAKKLEAEMTERFRQRIAGVIHEG